MRVIDLSSTHRRPDATIHRSNALFRLRMSNKWWNKHPWLTAIAALLCGLVNGYEAVYVRPNSPMAIVDGAFAIGGFLAFLGLFLSALSDYFYKSEE